MKKIIIISIILVVLLLAILFVGKEAVAPTSNESTDTVEKVIEEKNIPIRNENVDIE